MSGSLPRRKWCVHLRLAIVFFAERSAQCPVRKADVTQPRPVPHTGSDGQALGHEADADASAAEQHPAPTERTPLLESNGGEPVEEETVDESNQIGLWILQFLLAVPFPVILIAQLFILHVDGLGQTLSDGSSAVAREFVSTCPKTCPYFGYFSDPRGCFSEHFVHTPNEPLRT